MKVPGLNATIAQKHKTRTKFCEDFVFWCPSNQRPTELVPMSG